MQFDDFKHKVTKIPKMELPGESFHYKMAPVERLGSLKKIAIKENTARTAAVLALFYPNKANETYLILILRKTYKGVHSNQVGFPGGKEEKEDASLAHTALRETEEEIGIPQNDITILKQLTQVYIPPSHFFVQPFIGLTQHTPTFIKQDEEVEALIEVPLSHFMDDGIVATKKITTSYATNIDVPAYIINDYVVWGATAMMLSEVREMLKQL